MPAARDELRATDRPSDTDARAPSAPQTALDAGALVGRLQPDRVPALQRSIGNAAVTRLLARQPDGGVPDAGPGPDGGTPGADENARAVSKFFEGLGEAAIEVIVSDPKRLKDAVGTVIAEKGLAGTQMAIRDIELELSILKGNRSDMHGVTPEREETQKKIERREKLLAALPPIMAEYEKFVDLFEAQGLMVISGLLQISERRVAEEKNRYGLQTNTEITERYSAIEKGTVYDFKTTHSMADNEQSKRMRTAAGELAGKVAAIRSATDAVNATMGLVPGPDGNEWGVVDAPGNAAAEKRLKEAHRDYDTLRYEKEAEFPILASFTTIDRNGGTNAIDKVTDGLRKISTGGPDATKSLAGDVDERLGNIRLVREGLADGDVRVWEMPDIVELTKKQLMVAPGSAHAKMVDEKVESARTFKVARDILLGVVAIALAVAAAPLTGGASLGLGAAAVAGTAAVAGAALSTYIAVEHLQEYQLEKAKGGTDFDRARTLTQEDPSLFWLALDIVGAVLDAKAAITAFKELAVVARTAVQARRAATSAEQIARVEGKELSDLRKQASKHMPSANAEQVVKSAERAAVKEQAELKGVHSKWESELSEDSQKLLHDNPNLQVTYREMDPEVRELLTRCGSHCIPPTATKGQEARLRKLLNKIPPRHRKGLKEFLYHHRDKLDDAIKDLEELFSADLGKEIEKAVAALEEGRLPQKDELVSGGRKGTKPGDVPDVEGGLEAGQKVPLELLRKTQNVLGKRIADAPAAVVQAWTTAVTDVKRLRGELTAANYRELYAEAQKRFWANVRDGAGAEWFTSNGFNFTTTKTGAPAVAIEHSGRTARKELAIELDHMLPKGSGDNWTKALDADNLQFLTGWDNWLLNEIERLVPEVGRGGG